MNSFCIFVINNGVMGAIDLKEYIKLQLEHADERILRIVASVFENYSKPIDDKSEEILDLLKESETEYSRGQTKPFKEIIDKSREKYS
jgi:RIO-like serine/threonine protein kinase